ncbi:MAG: PEGA domain-containing protein [Polyangiaceae bacterium]
MAALGIASPSLAADHKKSDTKSADQKKAADEKAAAEKAAADKAAADAKAAEEAKSAPADSPAAKAKALYSEGVDLTNQRDFQGAEAKFEQAWSLQKSYDVAANLGVVDLELNKPDKAALYLTYALQNYPASGQLAKRDFIEGKLKEALAKVARLTISVNVVGAEVKLNGKRLGQTPIEGEQFLPEGTCKIEVSATGYDPDVEELKLTAGSDRKLKIDLHPPPKSPLPAIVVGGVGVLGLAAGVALSIVSTSKYGEAKSLHDEIVKDKGTCAGAAASPKCADLKSAAELSDALYGPGLGLVIGGAVLAAAGGSYLGYTLFGSTPAPGPAPDKPASGPRITRVGVRGTGILLQGSF